LYNLQDFAQILYFVGGGVHHWHWCLQLLTFQSFSYKLLVQMELHLEEMMLGWSSTFHII
jgi:hypothetical protein